MNDKEKIAMVAAVRKSLDRRLAKEVDQVLGPVEDVRKIVKGEDFLHFVAKLEAYRDRLNAQEMAFEEMRNGNPIVLWAFRMAQARKRFLAAGSLFLENIGSSQPSVELAGMPEEEQTEVMEAIGLLVMEQYRRDLPATGSPADDLPSAEHVAILRAKWNKKAGN